MFNQLIKGQPPHLLRVEISQRSRAALWIMYGPSHETVGGGAAATIFAEAPSPCISGFVRLWLPDAVLPQLCFAGTVFFLPYVGRLVHGSQVPDLPFGHFCDYLNDVLALWRVSSEVA
jgi:hypothetical protein